MTHPAFGASGSGVALVLVLLTASCTFERRPDLEQEDAVEEGAPPGEASEFVALDRRGPPEGVMQVFREAVVLGDLSLALSLLDRDAVLLDELVGDVGDTTTRGELLIELRRRHAQGLALEVLETNVDRHGEAALVMSRLAILDEDEDGIGVEVGRAYETVLLVPAEDGWRIRHFHRSVTGRDPL